MVGMHGVLIWFHIVLVACWLGAEWGVFNVSTNVADPALSFEERKRHLETAFRIDILPRSAIVFMPIVGLALSADLHISPIRGAWMAGLWFAAFAWLGLVWAAYRHRGTDRGIRLTVLDERIRTVVIPAMLVASIASLLTGKPFPAKWMAVKFGIFGILLFIGLLLRWTMRAWVQGFRMLQSGGPSADAEQLISGTLVKARRIAYVYWVLIATNAFLGVNQPF